MNDSQPVQRESFKAVILGDTGVGKTALMTRWTTGSYRPDYQTTVGANHQMKKVVINGQNVEIYLWDTAGQEQFQSLTPLYARSASVAILTTAINMPDSFVHIEKWINLLESATQPTPPVVLAVNKIDLEPSISRDEIMTNYSSQFQGYFFVSAKNNEMVDELFEAAAKKGYDFYKQQAKTYQENVIQPSEKKSCC